MKRWLVAEVFAALLAMGAGLEAQVVGPIGPEFQVNTYTINNQVSPAVCGTADGRFVAAWNGAEADPLRNEIFAQRYASDGSPVGTEFQVNTYTPGQQERPSMCCDGAGNFVVTWQQESDQDGDADGVFGQRFASDGTFLGTEFQVNTHTVDNQSYPATCCDGDGNFVVSWASYEQDGARNGVFAQRFASNGAPSGTEFQVNTHTAENQTDPAICCNAASGDFVVTWESYGQDGEANGVFAQRFDSSGGPRGTEFQVNTYTAEAQDEADLCCGVDGDFVVAWESRGQDGSGDGIFSQRFASDGAALGSEFQVNTVTTFSQYDPSLCCHDGAFVVAWASQLGGPSYGIIARRFADSGQPLSGDVTVTVNPESYANTPVLACREDSGFVVIWADAGTDGDDFGIFGQRFGPLSIASTPVLSWLGLAGAMAALFVAGLRRLRRRSR
jgi:hypothetical protein